MSDHSNEQDQELFRGMKSVRNHQRLLRKGIAMNNKAIADLSHGARRQAPYEAMKKAFHLFRRGTAKASSLDTMLSSSSSRNTVNVCHDAFPLRCAKDSFRDQGYIYNRLLSIEEEQLPSNPKIAGDLCLAIIILNLALINHHESMINMKSTKEYANLANNLYNHAISVLGHMENRGTAALVRIAALNNLTQLRYQVGNNAQARESLNHLALIVSAGSLETYPRKRPVIDEEAKKGMIMNILSLSNQHVAAAA